MKCFDYGLILASVYSTVYSFATVNTSLFVISHWLFEGSTAPTLQKKLAPSKILNGKRSLLYILNSLGQCPPPVTIQIPCTELEWILLSSLSRLVWKQKETNGQLRIIAFISSVVQTAYRRCSVLKWCQCNFIYLDCCHCVKGYGLTSVPTPLG